MSIDLLKDVAVPFGSTLVGAAASYLASSRLANRSAEEVLRRDAEARRDHDRRAVHQVFVKLHIIVNSLGSYDRQVQEMIGKADADGNAHMPLYQRISPFAGVEREPSVEFSAEELAVYIAGDQADYVDDLLLLSRRYAACLASLSSFGVIKTELHLETARLGATVRDPLTGVSTTSMRLSPSEANYVKVKADELDLFAQVMCNQLSEYTSFASDVARRFEVVTREFIRGKIIGFAAPVDRPVGSSRPGGPEQQSSML